MSEITSQQIFDKVAVKRVIMTRGDVVRVVPEGGDFPEGSKVESMQEWAARTNIGPEAVYLARMYGIMPESE